MPYKIEKRKNQFCLVKADGSKTLGCHPSKAEAEKQMAAVYAHERNLIAMATEGYQPRREQHNGKEHLVVPVVALVEGVVHPLNAKLGPEMVPFEVFAQGFERWEGMPLYEGHPLVDNKPVRGNTRFMKEQKSFGEVRNPRVLEAEKKLLMEAWLDVERARARAPEMLSRAEEGEPIEISVGVLVASDPELGDYDGKSYASKWNDYDPDHLALLPENVLGACSRQMGCGVRVMQEGGEASSEWTFEELYSEDQARDERGMFIAAAGAHEKAAAAHLKAAASHGDKSIVSEAHAENHSYRASMATNEALKQSNAVTRQPHGESVKAHATLASQASAARAGAFKKEPLEKRKELRQTAQEHHLKAAEHHQALAELIKKAGEVEHNLRSYEAGKGLEVLWPDKSGNDDHGRAAQAHEKAAAAHEAAAKASREAKTNADPATTTVASHVARQASEKASKASAFDKGANEAKKAQEYANASRNANSYEEAAAAHDKAVSEHRDAAYYHKYHSGVKKKGQGYEAQLEDLRDISQAVRDKADASDFAGPNESFPILKPEDVAAASHALGRAKGDRNAIKRRIISIAYRKGDSFVAQLPEDWKKKKDITMAQKFMETMRGFFRVEDLQDANEMGMNDLRGKLFEAIREVEPTIVNVEDVFPVTDPTHVVYACFDPMDSSWGLYERSFTLADSGVVTVSDTKIEVVRTTKYEPAEGATPTALEENAGEGAPDSHNNQTPEVVTMKPTEKVSKYLEGATECQMKALESFIEAGGKMPETSKQPTEAELRAAADAQQKAIGDAVTKAVTEDRAAQAAEAKKTATIKTLMAFEGQPFKAEELAGKSQGELDSLVALAEKVAKAPAKKEMRGAVDFGGLGGPKDVNEKKEEAPDAPNLQERILQARKK